MTVANLTEELKKMPSETKVLMWDDPCDEWVDPHPEFYGAGEVRIDEFVWLR